jgi:EAL domain-containing protein (putative c-di-GMP-specific phosphodiesterase class I)
MFELTETAFISSFEDSREVIYKIIELGFNFAIDDFGSGYSSLGYLKTLPFSVIKIDKMFVDDLVHNQFDQEIVQMAKRIGDITGAKLCVEGVETKAQVDKITELKCEFAQGYYFSIPKKIDELK